MSSESLKESVIVGIVKKMKQMDMSTLIIVKAATDALEAKERLDREAKREEKSRVQHSNRKETNKNVSSKNEDNKRMC